MKYVLVMLHMLQTDPSKQINVVVVGSRYECLTIKAAALETAKALDVLLFCAPLTEPE